MKTLFQIKLIILLISLNPFVLRAQNDALTILPNGNVGIATTTPKSTLDVNGNIKAKSSILADTVSATTGLLIYLKANKGIFTDTVSAINGNFSGNLNASKGNFSNALSATSGTFSGNVNANKGNFKDSLMAREIKASRINGEKLPMIFDVGDISIINKWQAKNIDIGSLCGDNDGCTIKIFLRDLGNDNVKTISEQIYIEQPGKSYNKTPGLSGFTRQLGGGDCDFILGADKLCEIIPHPWDWIYVRNYGSPEVGSKTPAYKGYEVQFMVRPAINATVIIYDR